MITFFNKLGNTWVAKIIFIALALSMMAFWGLGGLANISAYENEAIEVGDTSMTPQELSKSFENARQNFSRMAGGQYISPAKALEMGLLDQVIQQEVTNMVRTQMSEQLGLTASNAAVQKYVENNPVFQDNLGNFDKNMFYAYLIQSGMTETQMAYALKKELAFKHLTSSVQELGYNPKKMAELAYQFKNEKRDIMLLYLTPSQIKVSQTPSEEDLKAYYEAYSENFMKPEFRHLRVLSLTPEMMLSLISINQEDIENAYQSQKDKYNKPEERDLYQIFFKTKEEADSVSKEVTATNFEEVATKKMGQSAESTHFGYTPKDQLMEELSTPVFNAAKGSIVGPINSSTGWHLFLIKDIKEAQITPSQQIKEEIKKTLALDRTYEKLSDVTRQLEDILGEGKSLSQAAAQLNLKLIDVAGVDISGNTPQGNKVDENTVNASLLQNIFTLQKGDVSSLVENNNGYLLAEIVNIDPVSVKPYESVKNDVKTIWIKEKQKEGFEKTVKEITEKAQKGIPLTQLVNTDSGTFELIQKNDFMRAQTDAKLTKMTDEIFAQKEGASNTKSIIAPNGSEAVITTVIRIKPSKVSADEIGLKVIQENTKISTGENMVTETFVDYMNSLGVKVNQGSIQKAFSVYKTQE